MLTLIRSLAAANPVLIAVDNSQWLDAATVAVLTYLARRVRHERVALMLTVRGRDGAEERIPFCEENGFGDQRPHRIHLAPLTLAELRHLVLTRTGVVLSRPELLRLEQACGGNPLAALQIAGALVGGGSWAAGYPPPVPRHWRKLVGARIRALPQQTRLALWYLSALRDPTYEQVRVALPTENVAALLDAAEQAGMIVIDGDRVCFTPPLFGPAIYAVAGREQRRVAHQRLAEVAPDLEDRARHLALANNRPDSDVAASLDRAARHAESRAALGTAAELWTLASHRTPAAGLRRGQRLLSAARCLFRVGDSARARVMLEAAVADTPPGGELARALLWLGTVVCYESSSKRGVEVLRSALPLAEADPELTVELHLRIATYADHDLGLRVASERAVRAGFASLKDAVWLRPAVQVMLTCLTSDSTDLAELSRAAHLPSGPNSPWAGELADAMLNTAAESVDLPRAREGWQGRLRRVRDLGEEWAVPEALLHLVEIECRMGHWALAGRYAEDLAEAVEQTGQHRWRGLALYARALAAAYLGQSDTAEHAVVRGLKLAEQLDAPAATAVLLAVRGFQDLSYSCFVMIL